MSPGRRAPSPYTRSMLRFQNSFSKTPRSFPPAKMTPTCAFAAHRAVDPALLLRADALRIRARREAREAVRPELDREPREQEADGDERGQHRRVPAREPEEARREREREQDGDDADAVAARPRVAEEPPRLEPDRVGLRRDVEQVRERDRAGQRGGDPGGGDRRARRAAAARARSTRASAITSSGMR